MAKPVRSILDPTFVYVPSAMTDVRKTFEIARCGEKECPEWWGCRKRGCYALAKERYGEQIVRFEPRPEHDQDTCDPRRAQGRYAAHLGRIRNPSHRSTRRLVRHFQRWQS
jgi:hypothetical protein